MEPVLLVSAIAGMNELLTRLRARDFWVALTIVLSAAIGAAFGFYHVGGLSDTLNGAIAGLGASGFITVIGHVGNKSVAQPSTLTTK